MSHINAGGFDFDLIVAPLSKELVAYANSFTRSRTWAEDIAQEALLSAWMSWDSWRPLSSDHDYQYWARAWLHRIVSNKFVEGWRRTKRRENANSEALTDPLRITDNTDSSCDNDKFGRIVEEAVGRLSPDRRAIIECRYLKDMETHEIAESLNVEHTTVRTRLVRIRQRLRPLLARFAREEYYLSATGVESADESVQVVESDTDCVDTVVRDHYSSALGVVESSPDSPTAG